MKSLEIVFAENHFIFLNDNDPSNFTVENHFLQYWANCMNQLSAYKEKINIKLYYKRTSTVVSTCDGALQSYCEEVEKRFPSIQ